MKKLVSMFLTLALVLSMGSVALAAEVTPSEAKTFTFKKSYETTAGNDVAVYPAETLKFNVTADTANPDATMITIADQTVSGNPADITVTVPAYTGVGKWNYTISEVAGITQGVTYAVNSFGVQVLVTYDENDSNKLVAATTFTTSDGSEGKIDEIVNKYDLGSLKVDKDVTGNLASKTEKFFIDVTLKAEGDVLSNISYNGDQTISPEAWENGEVTVTVELAHGEDVTFSDIPAGVTYTVEEQSTHTEADANGNDTSRGYTATYTDKNGTVAADTTSNASVLNTKGTTVDTGIGLDSIPYIVLLGAALVGLLAFFGKRRPAR